MRLTVALVVDLVSLNDYKKNLIQILQLLLGQLPHLAPTYAAVLSLCLIESDEALEAIDMKGIKAFLWSVRESSGAFRMHVDGELDVRGAYCAVTVARLSGISPNNKLFEGTAHWIAECQTYEGGFGGAPGTYFLSLLISLEFYPHTFYNKF